ncbi:MAG: immunity 49 family protein [Alteromonadales bacterium]|nr:immunity 49 family protein [Alteromonadales bacterium]
MSSLFRPFPLVQPFPLVEYIKVSRDNLNFLARDSANIVQFWSFNLCNEIKKKSINALKLSSKSSTAIFQLGIEPEKVINITIDSLLDAEYNGVGLLEDGRLHAIAWQKAFFSAAIVRDKESMDTLVQFPVSLMRKCSTKNAEAEYLFVELIQSLYRRDSTDEFMVHLRKIMKQVSEENDDKWVEYCTGAKLDFIVAFSTSFDSDPNEKLVSALKDYWDYHEKYLDSEEAHTDFYLPLDLLGLACMAKDRGVSIEVESNFIPQFYINGEYL